MAKPTPSYSFGPLLDPILQPIITKVNDDAYAAGVADKAAADVAPLQAISAEIQTATAQALKLVSDEVAKLNAEAGALVATPPTDPMASVPVTVTAPA